MSDKSDKPIVVIVVTDIIDKGINAGNLAKIIGNEMGGGGGGKPSLATAGGKDLNTYTLAMKKIDLIKSELKVEVNMQFGQDKERIYYLFRKR